MLSGLSFTADGSQSALISANAASAASGSACSTPTKPSWLMSVTPG
jgi:hypothetical protein